jgi:EAL domain-containing protein (putative c-di-GMP-specific phosphodiesterase class I)
MREPFAIQGHELRVSASIGIASFPNDAKTEAELIRLADTAMYQAKAAGRNRHLFYEEEMNVWAQERRDIEQALKVAIERREFCLHYQPQVDLKTLRILGFEALLRWDRPGAGLVYPATFIARLEETGLIGTVTDWVMSEVCGQLARWRDLGLELLPVAINISPRQFVPDTHAATSRDAQEGQLAQRIGRCLTDYLLTANLLELEVTETSLMIDGDFARKSLSAVRALGVRIHIDDFGTGYSSLAQLKRLPLDSIKLDGAFVKDLPDGVEDVAVVRAVIALAHNLGFTVIAEGVETAAQHEFLAAAGCNSAQGFWYARPLPPEEVPALLQAGTLG